MKKTYIAPAVVVIACESNAHLLSYSVTEYKVGETQTVGGDDEDIPIP
ncbi:hypothetical protein [Xylanibacter brevis]|nr:hypothetical protein [Xylanibacter brevis]